VFTCGRCGAILLDFDSAPLSQDDDEDGEAGAHMRVGGNHAQELCLPVIDLMNVP